MLKLAFDKVESADEYNAHNCAHKPQNSVKGKFKDADQFIYRSVKCYFMPQICS